MKYSGASIVTPKQDGASCVVIDRSASLTDAILKTTTIAKTKSKNPGTQSGTIAVTSGSAAVTGTGTGFLSSAKIGDMIINIDTGQSRIISAIASDTALTVSSNFTSTDASSTYQLVAIWYEVALFPGVWLEARNVFADETEAKAAM